MQSADSFSALLGIVSFRTVLLYFGLALACASLRGQVTHFVYVTNEFSSSVSVYRVDDTTGALSLSSVTAAGTGPNSIVVDPSGRFAYVANTVQEFAPGGGSIANVFAYAIDPNTGALTPLPGSPFQTGVRCVPENAYIHPSGKFLYLANDCPGPGNSFVSALNIDSVSGALTPITGSPFSTGVNGQAVTSDPGGKFLFATAAESHNIYVFNIDPTTGALTPAVGSPFPAIPNSDDDFVAVDPTASFLYVSSAQAGEVQSFSYNTATGALTETSGSPFPAGSSPMGMAIDPTGSYLYVGNTSSGDISAYSINSIAGVLSPVPGSPFPTGGTPTRLAVDPTGSFLYSVNATSNNVSAFAISANTGALTPVPGSPFAAASRPNSIAIATVTSTSPLTILPSAGGNAGQVTVQIFGSGFQSGATAKLTGIGPDILGTNTTVTNASVMMATFDLTGSAPGLRGLTVTNPDSSTAFLPSAFTVQAGGAPQISVEIIGRDKIRIGQPQAYYAVIRNQGSVDAPSVVGTFSSTGDTQISLNPAIRSQELAEAAKRLSSDIPHQLAQPGAVLKPFYVGPVHADSFVAAPISILEPSPNCSTLQTFTYSTSSLDPCAVLDAGSDAADAYLAQLYSAKLANVLVWSKLITPVSSGGLGSCFNLDDTSTKISCIVYKVSNALLDGLIANVEQAKDLICALQMLAGCPGNCSLPQNFIDLVGIANGLSMLRRILKSSSTWQKFRSIKFRRSSLRLLSSRHRP